jgi:hypothetical protein
MKQLYLPILLIISFLFTSNSSLCGQEGIIVAYHQDHEQQRIADKSLPGSITDKVNYSRHHKKLPVTHSGFVIQLTVSDLPLKRDYPLFQQFGKIYYDQLKDGKYAYCITTDFSSRKNLEHFLTTIILPRAPKASIVEYHRGRRK